MSASVYLTVFCILSYKHTVVFILGWIYRCAGAQYSYVLTEVCLSKELELSLAA